MPTLGAPARWCGLAARPFRRAAPEPPARFGRFVRARLRADATLAAFGAQLALARFHLERAFFAFRDRLAALRDRLPAMPETPASTLLAYGAVGVMATILAHDLIRPAPVVSTATGAVEPPAAWIELPLPHSSFALESPALDGLKARHVIRRHRTSGGRKDELTWGDARGAGAYVRVALHRPGTAGAVETDPFEAVVTVAAESAIDAELQETANRLRTKFGSLPLVAMTVKERDEPRACLAAAGSWDTPRLALVAWWCNRGPEIVPPARLACLLDRLALLSAGGDERLAEFFAAAELRRGRCDVQSTFLSPTPPRPDDWVHARTKPRLRGALAGR